jgi:DNA-binding NtrC family response regulator
MAEKDSTPRILACDVDDTAVESITASIDDASIRLEIASDRDDCLGLLKRGEYDLVFVDLSADRESGLNLLEQIRDLFPETLAIALSSVAEADIQTAETALASGAYDFFPKPTDLTRLRRVVDQAIERVRLSRANRDLRHQLGRRGDDSTAFRRIVRLSAAMEAVSRTVKQVALTDVPVLLRGETGVGKELAARSIHERSKRSEGPFVAVNCGGFTEDLFSSELFGHVRGAFTGAHADRPGRFAIAEKGTLFLDEIGEVPLKNQVELLRALESREYQPLGDTEVHHADVRIIAASNRDLEASVQNGSFRDDLYYRLNVVPIDVPPLRSRRSDIPVLIETFLEEACRAYDQPLKRVDADTMESLIAYPWPGNVRELRNLIQRLVVTTAGPSILAHHLEEVLGGGQSADSDRYFDVAIGSTIENVEAELIRQTLLRVTSNRRDAATVLGISVRSLQYKLKKYKIQ